MSGYLFCEVSRENQILIVTLNQPDVRNSLRRPANLELDIFRHKEQRSYAPIQQFDNSRRVEGPNAFAESVSRNGGIR